MATDSHLDYYGANAVRHISIQLFFKLRTLMKILNQKSLLSTRYSMGYSYNTLWIILLQKWRPRYDINPIEK